MARPEPLHSAHSFPSADVASHTNRWGIALAGVLLQTELGAVYAWSVFRKPLAGQFHWSVPQITLAFMIAIVCF